MALSPSILATSLEQQWLVAEGGSYPSTPAEAGDRFAGAVSGWFAQATAGPYPCATAAARRAQLAATATAALQTASAQLAGAQLGLGLMGYMAGQVFGPGVASPPTAVGAGQSAITAAFVDLDAPQNARANRIASGVHAMAISTLVVFPPVVGPPVPVT